jgi:hypothetical protein
VLVVMLAYMIIRKLRSAWHRFDVTVEEGLKQLSTLCSMEIKVSPTLAVPWSKSGNLGVFSSTRGNNINML